MRKIFWHYLRNNLDRFLTQFSRDPDSPTFGSFDRDFWHYKIRDFSSMVRHQGVVVLDVLYHLDYPDNPLYKHPYVEKWIDGGLEFWASQQLAKGSFNEYYPYEQGIPPTAFSLYAVGLVLKKRGFPHPPDRIHKAIQKACDWLLKNPETEASNQEMGELAALALAGKVPGIRVDENIFQKRLERFFASQSREGWFPEYGGPDTGYLSVTIDLLWDYFEMTGDDRAIQALEGGVDFLSKMVAVSHEIPVMTNVRNTDYILPYGLVRAAKANPTASALVNVLFESAGKPGHFLSRSDDLFTCHFTYQSCYRSLEFLDEISHDKALLPFQKGEEIFLDEAGIYVKHFSNEKSIYFSLRKGGVVYLIDRKGVKNADFGYRLLTSTSKKGKKFAVTHWPDPDYKISFQPGRNPSFTISGKMSAHGWLVPSPMKHIALRLISFLSGRKIVPMLKWLIIFRKSGAGVNFERKIDLQAENILIRDKLYGVSLAGKTVCRAPHYSMRHVTSANKFIPEELIQLPELNEYCEKHEVELSRIIKY
jgi:hypothetical protein